jgi:hypothetical protein
MKAWSAVLVVALGGCVSSGTQVSQQAALQFKEHVTTEAEILRALGPPTGITVAGGKKYISYMGMQSQVKAATFIPIVGTFAGGADYQMTQVMYELDANGVLEKVTYSSTGSGMRSGTAPAEMPPREPSAK